MEARELARAALKDRDAAFQALAEIRLSAIGVDLPEDMEYMDSWPFRSP